MSTPSLPFQHKLPARLRHLWETLYADRAAFYTIGLAVFLHLVLWFLVVIGYFQLPPIIPLHFDAFGQPDRIEPRSHIFFLPTIAFGLLLVNGVGGLLLRQWVDEFAAYLLWGGAVVVQLLFLIAVLSVIL